MIYMVFDEPFAQMACNTLNNHLFAEELGMVAELSHTRSVAINSDCYKVRTVAEKIADQYGGRIQDEDSPRWVQPVLEDLKPMHWAAHRELDKKMQRRKRTYEANGMLSSSIAPVY